MGSHNCEVGVGRAPTSSQEAVIVICLQRGISLTGYINHTLGQATRPSSRSQHKMNPMVSLKACCLILVCLGFFFWGGVLLFSCILQFLLLQLYVYFCLNSGHLLWLSDCFLKRKEKKTCRVRWVGSGRI